MKKALLILIFIPAFAFSQAALPDAIGHGANVTGGEGQVVVTVTNTNDSGPGSLRDAIAPNTYIIFEKGGRIDLSNQIVLPSTIDNVTISIE